MDVDEFGKFLEYGGQMVNFHSIRSKKNEILMDFVLEKHGRLNFLFHVEESRYDICDSALRIMQITPSGC